MTHKCGRTSAYRIEWRSQKAVMLKPLHVCLDHFRQATSLMDNTHIGFVLHPDSTGTCDVEMTRQRGVAKIVIEKKETP